MEDSYIETIDMRHYGNIAMFNTTTYHKTDNHSDEDRISFVIEII